MAMRWPTSISRAASSILSTRSGAIGNGVASTAARGDDPVRLARQNVAERNWRRDPFNDRLCAGRGRHFSAGGGFACRGKCGPEHRADHRPDAGPNGAGAGAGAKIGAYIAAFVYAANPNLLYTQVTALTEPLAMAFFIWALVYFGDFLGMIGEYEAGEHALTREARRALRNCGLCVACAELTRYDGWFLAGVLGLLTVAIGVAHWRDRALCRVVIKFVVVIAVAPALWLAYNAAIYGSPLAFATGPYSAKAIEARVGAPNPGAASLVYSGSVLFEVGAN